MELKFSETPSLTYDFANRFKSFTEKKDYTKMTEQELLEELKKLPDFDKLVYPNEWYGKYELPLKECMNMKEFLIEAPWMKRFSNNYIGKLEIAAKPGGNRPVLPPQEVPAITLIQNSFSEGETTNQISFSNPQENQ
jgi:hypothetical protein